MCYATRKTFGKGRGCGLSYGRSLSTDRLSAIVEALFRTYTLKCFTRGLAGSKRWDVSHRPRGVTVKRGTALWKMGATSKESLNIWRVKKIISPPRESKQIHLALSRLVNGLHISMGLRVEKLSIKDELQVCGIFLFRVVLCANFWLRVYEMRDKTDNIAGPQKCFSERMFLREHSSIIGEKGLIILYHFIHWST